ncbi:MAG: FAD-binding protein, partial [Deltaproteobacteria bacterium]|nr:FAD-binding protein [Deltaproteobacteria bacterium]
MASALGVNGNGDMRMEARSLVNRALTGDEVSRQHLRDLIDGSPRDLEAVLRDASTDAGMHKRARRSAVRPPAATATGVSPHWESRETYEGDQDVVVMQPLRLYEPETLDDLVFIVKKAEELGHTVKALGAGCSYSGANATSGFLVDMEGLDAMLPIDAAALHPGDHATLRRFQGGARLDQISEHLKQDDLALENMGGLLQLSFVGAATTGTHGSGVRLGNMASQIVSMVVVGSGGTVYRVEPKHGITNPSGWDEPLVDHLKQDDELFHSLRVSVGALGLIYSVTVRTVPLTNLREVRWEMGWQEARERL